MRCLPCDPDDQQFVSTELPAGLRGRTGRYGRKPGRTPTNPVGCIYSIFLQIDRIPYVAEFVHPTPTGLEGAASLGRPA